MIKFIFPDLKVVTIKKSVGIKVGCFNDDS